MGSHDALGPKEDGWRSPFFFEVTDKLKDGENVIALRCHDAAGKGGIWKGVQIVIVDDITQK